jgi:hypothetical protein
LLLLQLVAGPTGTVPSLDTSPTFSAATAQVSFAVPAVAITVQLLSCYFGISSILGLLQTFSAATASASITVHVVATNVNALAVQVLLVLQPSLI